VAPGVGRLSLAQEVDLLLESKPSEVDVAQADAISWFDETLGPREWINHTWIGRLGSGELRVVDIVCPDGSHRLLWRVVPSDDGVSRLDGLDYEGVQETVDSFREMAGRHGFIVFEFAGPAVSIPGLDLEVSPALETGSPSD
jgi:hypothetical protein